MSRGRTIRRAVFALLFAAMLPLWTALALENTGYAVYDRSNATGIIVDDGFFNSGTVIARGGSSESGINVTAGGFSNSGTVYAYGDFGEGIAVASGGFFTAAPCTPPAPAPDMALSSIPGGSSITAPS